MKQFLLSDDHTRNGAQTTVCGEFVSRSNFRRFRKKVFKVWNHFLKGLMKCNLSCIFLVSGRFQRLKSRLRKTLMETWPKHSPLLTLIVEKTELVNAFLPLPTKSKFFITLHNIFLKG